MLGVRATSVLGEDAAREMATGGARLLNASAVVATTGVAGPGPVGDVPAGPVFIATLVDGVTRSATHRFPGGPVEVIDAATGVAIAALAGHLRAGQPDGAEAAGVGSSPASCPHAGHRRPGT